MLSKKRRNQFEDYLGRVKDARSKGVEVGAQVEVIEELLAHTAKLEAKNARLKKKNQELKEIVRMD